MSSQPSKKLKRHPFRGASSTKTDNGEGASASRSKYITEQVNVTQVLFTSDSMENNLFPAITNPPHVQSTSSTESNSAVEIATPICGSATEKSSEPDISTSLEEEKSLSAFISNWIKKKRQDLLFKDTDFSVQDGRVKCNKCSTTSKPRTWSIALDDAGHWKISNFSKHVTETHKIGLRSSHRTLDDFVTVIEDDENNPSKKKKLQQTQSNSSDNNASGEEQDQDF